MVDLEIVLGGFALGITGGRHVRSVSETGTKLGTKLDEARFCMNRIKPWHAFGLV